MSKLFSAVAAVSGVDNTGADEASAREAFETLKGMMEKYPNGSVLDDADCALAKECLPKIGCAETCISEDGTLEGADKISYTAEGAGLVVEVNTKLNCKSLLNHGNTEWLVDMTVTKTGGAGYIAKLEYEYGYLSFGTSADGRPKIFHSHVHKRAIKEGMLIDMVNEGQPTETSHVDFSSKTQWGFFIYGMCRLVTPNGALIV